MARQRILLSNESPESDPRPEETPMPAIIEKPALRSRVLEERRRARRGRHREDDRGRGRDDERNAHHLEHPPQSHLGNRFGHCSNRPKTSIATNPTSTVRLIAGQLGPDVQWRPISKPQAIVKGARTAGVASSGISRQATRSCGSGGGDHARRIAQPVFRRSRAGLLSWAGPTRRPAGYRSRDRCRSGSTCCSRPASTCFPGGNRGAANNAATPVPITAANTTTAAHLMFLHCRSPWLGSHERLLRRALGTWNAPFLTQIGFAVHP